MSMAGRRVAFLALVALALCPHRSAAGAETAMTGPYASPFATTCAALRSVDPASRCERALAERIDDRDVEIHRVTSSHHHVALYVALRDRRGWYVSRDPIEWWLRATSWMTEATSSGRVSAIDARPARIAGVATVVLVVRTAWTRDCGGDCDDGHSSFTRAGATVCGVGSSGQPSCTTPIDVRGFGAGGPEVRVEHDALVVRGSDLEDGATSIDFR
jgi:hypothetical protein